MESQIIIKNIGQELRTDSRLLAQFLDHRHRTILENVVDYPPSFRAWSSQRYGSRNNH